MDTLSLHDPFPPKALLDKFILTCYCMLDEEGNNTLSIHFSNGKNDKHVDLNPSRKGIFLRGFLFMKGEVQ